MARPVIASLALSFMVVVLATPRVDAQQQPPARAQGGSITGTVTHSVTNEPLEGVTVKVVGTSLGAVTNAQGRYTISGVSPGI